MNKRMREFQDAMREDLEPMTFVEFASLLFNWAIYVFKGGTRPGHPH